MKKLVLLVAVVFSVSLFSCGSSEKTAEVAADTVALEEVDTVAIEDSACCADSACVAKCDTAAVKCNAACDSVK